MYSVFRIGDSMKKKKKKNRLLQNILIFIIPILLCIGGYYIYDNYIKQPGIPSVNKLIEEKKKNNYQDKDDNKIDISNYSNPLPAIDKNMEMEILWED